jgi:predicted dinucleotide-binding enzyme
MKYEKAMLTHDLKSAKVKQAFNKIEEEYKLTDQDYIRIDLHLYSKDNGAVHNIAYQLEKTGINYLDNTPVAPGEIFSTIARYQSDDFLETE